MQPLDNHGMMAPQGDTMIDSILTLAHHPIDWSIAAGPIWLVTGLVAVGVPMAIGAIGDLLFFDES
jgi:hypothetical protein